MIRNTDFLSGLVFVGIGLAFGLGAVVYRFGTPANMGSGFLPLCLAVILALLGIGIMVKAWREEAQRIDLGAIRPLVVIIASIAIFALALRPLGFALTAFMTVLAASFAGPPLRLLQRLVPAIALSVFSTLVFITLLGLPIPIWPQALG